MQFFTLKIIGLKQETGDTTTILFRQPALKKVKYKAGQYLTLVFRINGRRYIRPYSFSSAPGVDSDLAVTVKRVQGGIVSNHIVDKLNVGDIIEVMPPMGDFVLNEDHLSTDTHLVLWGGGSGITPLISIAKYALYNKLAGHITLVYGNRNAESAIFIDDITQLEERFSSFSTWHFHTQLVVDPARPSLVQGRIDPHIVLKVLQQEGNLQNTVHYICGPSGLKESIKEAIFALQINANNVYSEDFEVVRNPADFEDVFTKTVRLIKEGRAVDVEVVKGKSILEAGLDAGIEMPYSCQTGNCLLCKGRLVKGDVKIIGVDTTPAELESDERLLCCSFPLSGNIEIEVNQ